MEKLTSKLFLRLKKEKAKNKFLLFLDNQKIISDALSSGNIKPIVLISSSDEILEKFKNFADFSQKNQNFDDILANFEKNPNFLPCAYKCDASQIDALCDIVTSQKVVLVAQFSNNAKPKMQDNFLVLDGLQDAGNVGTLIRTAKASGFSEVYLLESVHKTNPKVIRSSVGAVFSSNVFEMSRHDFIDLFNSCGRETHLLKTDMAGESIFKFNFSGVVGVVISN